LSPRDQVVKAAHDLQMGQATKKQPGECKKALDIVTKLSAQVPADPKDHELTGAKNAQVLNNWALTCYAKAGECDDAWKTFASNPIYSRLPEEHKKTQSGLIAPACKK